MSEQPPTSDGYEQPDEPAPPEVVPPAAAVPPPASPAADGSASLPDPTADRPETPVVAAFAGGLVLALILKRLVG